MNILGISAFYHDSAACLVQDGKILAAAQEERFTRIKHDSNFPSRAIQFCLNKAGLHPSQIDYVAYYEKPLLTFDRLMESWLAFSPLGFRAFLKALPVWLQKKLFLPKIMDEGFNGEYQNPYLFLRHHESHAASAFFPSPFEKAAILTIDGVGEWSTTTLGVGEGNKVKLLKEIRFPHSLGLLYSAFTFYTGFRVNSGEYKVMGLAPYGKPIYEDVIWKHLIELKDDGSFRLNMKYFEYGHGLKMTSSAFHKLFGRGPRNPETPITQMDMDLAASIQKVCEVVMVKLAKEAKRLTGANHLVLAGGCALNCVANGKIVEEKIFEDVFVQPAAGDAGGALGAALFTWHDYLDNPRTPEATDSQRGSFLGPHYTNDAIEAALGKINAPYKKLGKEALVSFIADQINNKKVIGLFQGPMEFGPRALGGRSIIGDARDPDMQTQMNLKIKFRESFRPFAPVVLEEKTSDYFDFSKPSPYMLMVAPVKQDKRLSSGNGHEKSAEGFQKLKIKRSVIPAVTHVDYSARLQTLSSDRNGVFYDVAQNFFEKTGCPVLINTSFNIRGEPIVCTPEEAYRCFMYTDIDVLVLENCVLIKEEQPALAGADEYKKQFKLD